MENGVKISGATRKVESCLLGQIFDKLDIHCPRNKFSKGPKNHRSPELYESERTVASVGVHGCKKENV